MAIFGEFFRPAFSQFFSEPRAARFRRASLIRTKATPCVQVWHSSNLRRLRLGEKKKKKKERRKKPQGKNIMACPITYGGHKNRHAQKKLAHFIVRMCFSRYSLRFCRLLAKYRLWFERSLRRR